MSNQGLTEHRTFLLTLDVEDGQRIAANAGYTATSPDVAKREERKVLTDWALLNAEGVLPAIHQYADWFVDTVLPDDSDFHDKMQQTHVLYTFAAATVARLKNRGLLETPAGKRLIPVIQEEDGTIVDDSVPDELMEHAAELYEWTHGGNNESR